MVGKKIICAATEDDVGCNTIGVPLNSFNVIFVNDFDQTVYWVLEHQAMNDSSALMIVNSKK